MSEWKTYRLGEISEDIAYGYTASANTNKIGPKFLRITDIQEDFINWNNVPYCSISAENYRKYRLEIGDIIIARTGASTGTTAIYKDENVDAVFASYLIRFKIDKLKSNPYFIGHILKSQMWKNYVGSIIGGSAQPGANAKQFADFELNLPDLNTQSQIASILTSLDDKIELNLQMNQTLEAMAQAIFKEWFIDFRFPGFDGQLVDGLPRGWRRGKLGDVIDVKGGTTPSTTKEEYWNGKYYWTTPKDLSSIKSPVLIDTERKITELGIKQINSGVLPIGTLLLSSRAPIGYLAISQIPVSINQGYIAIQGKEVSNLFMLFWLKQNMESVKSKANGSTFQEISKTNFKQIDVIIPSSLILKKFDIKIGPIFQKIVDNVYNNLSLTQTRDTLLPKLMSGDIEVTKKL